MFTVSRTSSDANTSDSMSVIDFLGIYFTSPPIAFGHLRQTISQYLCPESLWTIYSYIGRFINGVAVEHDAFSEFVFVPVPTNVYTIMKPFYQDGGVFGVAFFALLGFIIYRGLKIAAKSKDVFGFMLAVGITMIFGIQTVINALVVTGSIPPTGLPLPLVSSGNTSIIIFMAEMGILFNISRQGSLTF